MKEFKRSVIGMTPNQACELQIPSQPKVVGCGAFNYIHCARCNRQLTFDINYCTNCGQRIDRRSDEI